MAESGFSRARSYKCPMPSPVCVSGHVTTERAMSRTIIVGDVHGMREELVALLAKVRLKKRDHLVMAGDLVDKGPDSAGVVQHLRGLRDQGFRITLVMGNHEAKHALFRDQHKKGRGQGMKGYAELKSITDALSKDDVAFLNTAVLFLRLPEHRALVVHAGIPGTLTELPESAAGLNHKSGAIAQVLRVRHITGKAHSRLTVEFSTDRDLTSFNSNSLAAPQLGDMEGRIIKKIVKPRGSFIKLGKETSEDPFWADVYDGRFGEVFFGHSPFIGSEPQCFVHATGLDTGAVFGGHLTAAVLEPGVSGYFVSVQASKRYADPLAAFDE